MKKFYTLLLAMSLSTTTIYASGKLINHTIKSGDSLYTIAKKYDTSVAELQKANSIKKGEILKLGNVLKVPSNTKISKKIAQKSSVKSTAHIICQGDTLFAIARKYHTTVNEIRSVNGIKSGETLKLGRMIQVPQKTNIQNSNQKIIQVASKTTKPNKENKKTIKTLAAKNDQSNKALKTALISHAAPLESKHTQKNNQKLSTKTTKTKSENICNVEPTRITSLAKQKLGKKYVWGATGNRDTFDCSGLTTYVYKKNGISLPRRAIAQSKVGKPVSKKELRKGDLVFFDTSKSRKGYVNHVGIYIGDGKFIHASSAKNKVVITDLSKSFYNERFKVARRVTPPTSTSL
ncbi:MAG: NlpC/P60 family protein [Sulfurovum sp.]|nr:NlpC/P60 family protein [Sulfurovum sp.]